MTNDEAYPNSTYLQRKNAFYNPGDKVKVGPAFRMGGEFFPDGYEGSYTVFGREAIDSYYLIKGDVQDVSELTPQYSDLTINVSRMTKR